MRAGTYSPLDAPHLRDEKWRPTPWLETILSTRNRIEPIVRGIHGPRNVLIGYTTRSLMALESADSLPSRAHAWLVEHLAPATMWDDPIL